MNSLKIVALSPLSVLETVVILVDLTLYWDISLPLPLINHLINAEAFCQANGESRFDYFDFVGFLKENCSANQARILEGKAKENCALDMELELCDRVKSVVTTF